MNDGGPAFPGAYKYAEPESDEAGEIIEVMLPGMSLRDWFAGQAMQGLIMFMPKDSNELHIGGTIAHAAYHMADAMLKERASDRKD